MADRPDVDGRWCHSLRSQRLLYVERYRVPRRFRKSQVGYFDVLELFCTIFQILRGPVLPQHQKEGVEQYDCEITS